ncbi:Hypothetical predicted protein [Paramuricea clavata]|uniref:Uncharacterized protein n=1 Tax=Paramuricea clavata TaxID=317549 RepID=A0A6S7H5S9_PARCT|nr:Hypothetical predicted protein [Paramuricea clavata]
MDLQLNSRLLKGHRTLISNDYTDIVLQIDEYFREDPTVKHKKETAKLKKQCNMLKQKLGEATAFYRPKFTGHKVADEPNTKQVPATSEKKKDPRRVEAGKRLAVLSKAERDKKKKQAESIELSSGNSIITYIGVAIALIFEFEFEFIN